MDPPGLCMETVGGVPIQLSHFNSLVKESLTDLFQETSERAKATSNGLRRFSPTAADVVELPWQERVAAGGWSEADAAGKAQNRMAWLYSGKRAEREMLR